MIYECFRATGANEAVHGVSDLFTISLQNDDVQDFDVKRDHGLLSVSEMPSDMILERLYKSTIQDSVHLGFVRSRNRSKQWTDKLFTIEDVCKTSR